MEIKKFKVDENTERFLQVAMKVEKNNMRMDVACQFLRLDNNPHYYAYSKLGQDYAKEILFYACLDSGAF